MFSQELYSDTTRTGLWMHNTVPRMFNVYRTPCEGCDVLISSRSDSVEGGTQTRVSRNIIVMLRDWTYTMEVYDSRNTRRSPQAIESSLKHIAMDVQTRLEYGEKAMHVGLLTTDDRDKWAKVASKKS